VENDSVEERICPTRGNQIKERVYGLAMVKLYLVRKRKSSNLENKPI